MKKLKGLKGLHNIFVDTMTELDLNLQKELADIKLEYQSNMIDEKIKLLMTICEGEELDFDKLKIKYLKPKELLNIIKEPVIPVLNIIQEEELFDKIKINGIEYYYEPKENAIVYNMESKPVGIFTNVNIKIK